MDKIKTKEELAQEIVAIVLGADASVSSEERTKRVLSLLNGYLIYET